MLRRLILLSVFLTIPLFSDNLEILPVPSTSTNSVGTNHVVVRGDFSSSAPLRVSVSDRWGNKRVFSHIIVFKDELQGYYARDIILFLGVNTIVLEEQSSNGIWRKVVQKEVVYDSHNTQSLWGRIANTEHNTEEQRSVFYFAGPRVLDNGFRKDRLETKGPAMSERYNWKSENDIDAMFDEISQAGVNIVKMSWWGNFNRKNKTTGTNDNFDMVVSAPTFPRSCNLILNNTSDLCIKIEKKGLDFSRTTCDCECSNDNSCLPVENKEVRCYLGICSETCSQDSECASGELCTEGHCLAVNFLETCHNFLYFTEDVETCQNIFDNSHDVYQHVFAVAAEKNILVAPVIELEPFHMLIKEFPHNLEVLKEKIATLIDLYGDNENWLQLYNKKGEPRRAICLTEALARTIVQNSDYSQAFDAIANKYDVGFVIDPTPLAANLFYPESGDNSVFIPKPQHFANMNSLLAINPFGMPFNGVLKIHRDGVVASPLLFYRSVVSFFNTSIPQIYYTPKYSVEALGSYGEDSFIAASKEWLSRWKESRLPVVADVIPGYDDRWRALPTGYFAIYGDNDSWRNRTAELSFYYNTAGISLTIWNGFTEGYVFVPYKKRKFKRSTLFDESVPYLMTLMVDTNDNPLYENTTVFDNYLYAQYLFAVDSDGDGVLDRDDGCPAIYNPLVEETNPYQELFAARGDGTYAGAEILGLGHFSADRTRFIWQPDHDLDGTPDACDADFAYNKITNVAGHSVFGKLAGSILLGGTQDRYAEISIAMPQGSGFNTTNTECSNGSCQAAVHYCALNYQEKVVENKWGTDGFCTNTERTENPLYADTPFYCDFGFSHGSDDYDPTPTDGNPPESILRWKRRVSFIYEPLESKIQASFSDDINVLNGYRQYVTTRSYATTQHFWNWRRDWYTDEKCYRSDNKDTPACKSVIHGGEHDEQATMYYTLSTSIKTDNENYLNSEEDAINSVYFASGLNKYARSFRYGTDGANSAVMELNYSTTPMYIPPLNIEPPLDLVEMEVCRFCYWKIPQKLITDEDGVPEWAAIKSISRWSLGKQDENYLFNTQQLSLPTSMELFGETSNKNIYAVTSVTENAGTGYELRLNTSASGAAWNNIGSIQGWDSEIRKVESVEKFGDTIYFIADKINDTGFPVFGGIDLAPGGGVILPTPICSQPPPTYSVINFGELNLGLASIKLISTKTALYLIGSDEQNNIMKLYRLNSDNQLDEINGLAPPARAIVNIYQKGRYLFLAGGLNTNREQMSDLWRFDTYCEKWEQVDVVLNGDFSKIIAQPVEGKLVMANPIINGNTSHPAFVFDPYVENIDDIVVDYIAIPVTAVEYEELNAYCIVDGAGDAVPGMYREGGCDALQQYNHHTTTYFDYKYTLSGSGKRLFLGGLTGIRTALILEDGSLQNEYFKWVGRAVNNIQISGNRLFAASSDKIRIYEVDKGELTQIGTINADSSRNIRIAKGKLFVADGRQVSIWNVNGEIPVLEREISTSYKVKDLEISNGILYIYEEEYYWYWFWLRKHTMFEVIELGEEDGDEQVTYTTDVECGDSEMMQDLDSVYLGCSNGQHRIGKGDGTALSNIGGEKNYFRDSYTYENKVYQTFSGAVHLSE